MRPVPSLLAVLCIAAVGAAWPTLARAQGYLPAHAHLAAHAPPAGHAVSRPVYPVHHGAILPPGGYVAAYPRIIHPPVPGHPPVVVPFPGHPPVLHPPVVHPPFVHPPVVYPPVYSPRVYRSYYYAAPYVHQFYYSTPGLSIGIGF